MGSNPLSNLVRRFARHHLGAPGRGLDMAVSAGLVAFAADVNLKGLEEIARENLAMRLKFLFE